MSRHGALRTDRNASGKFLNATVPTDHFVAGPGYTGRHIRGAG